MFLGAVDLPVLLARMNTCAPPVNHPDWQAWKAQYDKLLAEADAFTQGSMQNTRTRKYYFMRSEIAKQWAREPITRCQLDAQKAGRKISDIMALNEIRKPRIGLSNEWLARATKEKRMEQIEIGAAVITLATAGAAAIASAAGAGAGAAAGSTAVLQSAAASALGVPAAAGQGFKAIGMAALKKLAIEKGVEKALEFAANEYMKYRQEKMTEKQEKELARELAAAQVEYNALIASGTNPSKAESVAIAGVGGGGIFPLGLAVLALKLLA